MSFREVEKDEVQKLLPEGEYISAEQCAVVRSPIIEHEELVTGYWFWKKQIPSIIIELNDLDRCLLNKTLDRFGLPLHPKNQPWIGVVLIPRDELYRFPVGSTVEMYMGFNGLCMNFMLGRTKVFVISVRNVTENKALLIQPLSWGQESFRPVKVA